MVLQERLSGGAPRCISSLLLLRLGVLLGQRLGFSGRLRCRCLLGHHIFDQQVKRSENLEGAPCMRRVHVIRN